MKIFKLMLLISALLMALSSTQAYAQMENTVAVLPIQANRSVAKSTTAEIYNRLENPLANREGFTVIPATKTARKLGRIKGSILSEANLSMLGPRFDANLLVACKMKLTVSSKSGRMNYFYEIAFFDVTGNSMIALNSGVCKACTNRMLGNSVSKTVEQMYAGPFILGLDTDPSGATISSNGEQWGETPIRKVLPSGSYKIIIEKAGYKKMEVEFPMPADRPIYATLPMEKDPDYVAPVVAAPVVVPEKSPAGELAVPLELPSIRKKTRTVDVPPPPVVERKPEVVVAEPKVKQMEEAAALTEVKKPADTMSLKRKWAWRTLGLTFAMAAGGVGFTVAAIHADGKATSSSQIPTSQMDYADRRDTYWIGAYTMYGLTAIACTTSLILFFTEDPDAKGPKVSVAPTLAPGSVGVSTLVRY